MAGILEGFTPYRDEDAERYNRLRWWPGLTLGDLLDKNLRRGLVLTDNTTGAVNFQLTSLNGSAALPICRAL